MKCNGWMNIYRSGHFHRAGKPCMFDRHPGDLYPTEEAARADIEPLELYIDTVPVEWNDPEKVQANPPDSQPIPLWKTRKPLKVAA